jgi:hypothetical protein
LKLALFYYIIVSQTIYYYITEGNIPMQNHIDDVLAKIKKINFEKVTVKNPEVRASSIDKLKCLIYLEKEILVKILPINKVNEILITALLERSKDVSIRKFTHKRLNKKDRYPDYLGNIATLHNNIAESLV